MQSFPFNTVLAETWHRHKTLIRYFGIGVSAALLDLTVFYIGYSLVGLVSPVATLLSVGLATLYAFLLNAFFNFRQTDRLSLRFLSYAAVSGTGLLVSVGFLTLFNVHFGFNGNLVKLLSLPMIFVLQYWLNKRITFQRFAQAID